MDAEISNVHFTRRFFMRASCRNVLAVLPVLAAGCRSYQYGHVISDDREDLVGSHAAGAAEFNPMIEESVGKLLARQIPAVPPDTHAHDLPPPPKSICFVGVENKSIEELGDFKDQLYQEIDTLIVSSDAFRAINRRFVESALRETRLRPDALMVPDNMRLFAAAMEQEGHPIDYLLYATLTSGTTVRNTSQQRDYLLTLELVDVHTGAYDKQSAKVRKGYHRTAAGKWWHYNRLKRRG
jgi:hypothetical protein